MATRIEKDFLGEKELPDTAYYGVQTLRGKENFHITGIPMSTEPYFVKAFGYVKKAAALANRDLGVLDGKIADAIVGACDRLIAGEMRDQSKLVQPSSALRISRLKSAKPRFSAKSSPLT